MAITQDLGVARQVMAGQDGFLIQNGIFTFTSTNLSGTLVIQMAKVESVHFTALQAPTVGDEQVYVDSPTMSGRRIVANGNLPIARIGTTVLSGAVYNVEIKGY